MLNDYDQSYIHRINRKNELHNIVCVELDGVGHPQPHESLIMHPTDSKNWGSDKGIWWIEPPDGRIPFEFCRDTSLHGLKYLEQPRRHLTERIFWFLAFLTGLIVAIVLINDVWRNFRDNPIIVSFAPFETTVDDTAFPAVTICNMNKVQKSKVHAIIKKLEDTTPSAEDFQKAYDDVYLLQHVCSESSGFSRTYNFSLHQGSVPSNVLDKYKNVTESPSLSMEEFLQSTSQRCSRMISLCLWENEPEDCRVLFNPIETKFGKCCTFNMVPQTLLHRFRNDSRDNDEEVSEWAKWNPVKDGFIVNDDQGRKRKFPRRQRRAGKTYGLSILLDPDLEEYFCTSSDAMGFRMATHLSTDVPHVSDFGIAIEPNREVFVNVKAEITIAEDTIHGFGLEKRLCYFPEDHPLHYYKYYTPSNCVEEVVAKETLSKCGCVRYYMPRDNKTELCGPTEAACAEEVKKRFVLQDLAMNANDCFPLCTEIEYSTSVTSTLLQPGDDNWQFPNESFAHWKNSKVSIVHIYFGEPSTYARVRKQFLSSVDLIAQTGGIMGLCLGFSGLSLIELIYYFTFRPWLQTKWQQNFGKKVFRTVAGAWEKTKHIAHHKNGHTPGVVPNLDEISGSKTHDHRGEGSQGGILQHINAVFRSKQHIIDEDIGVSDAPAKAIFGEIAPYYGDRHQQTQYWNKDA